MCLAERQHLTGAQEVVAGMRVFISTGDDEEHPGELPPCSLLPQPAGCLRSLSPCPSHSLSSILRRCLASALRMLTRASLALSILHIFLKLPVAPRGP